jgi:hypothetical protein
MYIYTSAVSPHTPPRRIKNRVRATAGTAHTEDKSVTAAVFHGPMFASNAVALLNACVPTPQRSTDEVRTS